MTRKPRLDHAATQTTSLPRFVGVDAIVRPCRLTTRPVLWIERAPVWCRAYRVTYKARMLERISKSIRF